MKSIIKNISLLLLFTAFLGACSEDNDAEGIDLTAQLEALSQEWSLVSVTDMATGVDVTNEFINYRLTLTTGDPNSYTLFTGGPFGFTEVGTWLYNGTVISAFSADREFIRTFANVQLLNNDTQLTFDFEEVSIKNGRRDLIFLLQR